MKNQYVGKMLIGILEVLGNSDNSSCFLTAVFFFFFFCVCIFHEKDKKRLSKFDIYYRRKIDYYKIN